jgi:ribonuclease HI
MKVAAPHYLLFSESCRKSSQGQWRFVLQSIDGSQQFEAADAEPDARGERLELLAVVRGLEALEQPSRVTLVTPSRYVNRGLTYGMEEWRANDWQWEHFGEMVPVKNRDLWQRVDRALAYHALECRTWRFDLPHATLETAPQPPQREAYQATAAKRRRGLAGDIRRRWLACQRWWDERRRSVALWSAQCGTRLLPLPWLE